MIKTRISTKMQQHQNCKKCFRPEATQHDWNTVKDGERSDLCWSNEDCDAIADGFQSESAAMASLLIKWDTLINSAGTTSLDIINFVVDNQGEVRQILARARGEM